MRYSVVIATWNACEPLAACLDSVAEQRLDGTLETIVVDNASTDGTEAMLRSREFAVRTIRNERNAGYCAGINQGARASAGEVLFLLNADTVLLDPDALARLAVALAAPGAGLVAPRYLWPDGSLQPGCANHPSVLGALAVGLGVHRVLPDRLLARVSPPHWSHDHSRDSDWVMGAALGIRAELFSALGGFWPLLYGSETDLAWRVHRRGWRVRYVSDARVMHISHFSNRQRFSEPRRWVRIARGELAFLATHYPRPRAEAIRLITAAAFAARAALLPLAGRLPRAREYGAMARAYARGLEFGREALREARR